MMLEQRTDKLDSQPGRHPRWFGRICTKARMTPPRSGAGDASRYIYVNGRSIVSNQLFPHTGSWSHWHNVTIPEVWLNAGSNTVSVSFNSSQGSRNWLNLDEMIVQ